MSVIRIITTDMFPRLTSVFCGKIVLTCSMSNDNERQTSNEGGGMEEHLQGYHSDKTCLHMIFSLFLLVTTTTNKEEENH